MALAWKILWNIVFHRNRFLYSWVPFFSRFCSDVCGAFFWLLLPCNHVWKLIHFRGGSRSKIHQCRSEITGKSGHVNTFSAVGQQLKVGPMTVEKQMVLKTRALVSLTSRGQRICLWSCWGTSIEEVLPRHNAMECHRSIAWPWGPALGLEGGRTAGCYGMLLVEIVFRLVFLGRVGNWRTW